MTPNAPERPRRPSRRRAGFTLIELLVVLVILALLIALLLPAIQGAVRRARSAAVQAEVNQMAQALAAFKTQFGDYPPSRVVLNENGGLPSDSAVVVQSGGVADITYGQLADRTATAMRKFWPRTTFAAGGSVWAAGSPQWYDFNGSGTADYGNFVLQGHECLVFFLGGIPLNVNGSISVIGFGKNPMNPFTHGVIPPPGVTNPMYSGNRTAPMLEFKSERLRMTAGASYPAGYQAIPSLVTLNGVDYFNPGYIDSLDGLGNKQSFYAYFCTNVGNGYDPNDVNLGLDVDANGLTPLTQAFYSGQPTYAQGSLASASTRTQFVESPSPNPYATGATYLASSTAAVAVPYQNPQTFQIISPGVDGMYGIGGAYTPTVTTVLPLLGKTNSSDSGVRNIERDDLTNFHNGTLD